MSLVNERSIADPPDPDGIVNCDSSYAITSDSVEHATYLLSRQDVTSKRSREVSNTYNMSYERFGFVSLEMS